MSLLLIDGRSGSGKTELAAAIAVTWPEVQVVHMDDIYEGWHGLERGSALLVEALTTRRYQRWDWAAGQRAEWHDLGPDLVVEGVGALTAASRAFADHAIWVETSDETRRERALARDDYFAEHWDEWAAQEQALIDREHPARLADSIVFGHNVATDAARWRAIVEP